MNNTGWFSRLSKQRPPCAMVQRIAGGIGVAILLMMTGIAVAQLPTSANQFTVPDGYTAHHTVDLGGRMTNSVGSGAMYDTMVNEQSGPRVLGETFEMHALPGKKKRPARSAIREKRRRLHQRDGLHGSSGPGFGIPEF